MHGRARIKRTPEQEQARREEDAIKIKSYRNLVDQALQRYRSEEYGDDSLALTTKILGQNPDFYTIWNFRRMILCAILEQAIQEEKQKTFERELTFLAQIIRLNPKSYWIFNHRRWCLQNMPTPDWDRELILVGKMLDLDARNFHGWDYRRYIIRNMESTSTSQPELLRSEFDYTTQKLGQNFSNYSAWHNRSRLLPRIVEGKSEKERREVADKEFQMVENAFWTDPADQSAWFYHLWLIWSNKESVIAPDTMDQKDIEKFNVRTSTLSPWYSMDHLTLIDREIGMIRRLLEELDTDNDTDSRWPLKVLVNLLAQQKMLDHQVNSARAEEARKILTKLMKLDQYRRQLYEDMTKEWQE
ncbi:uncharacterized protein VTP21DRAFT_1690 [Calcarisporiella thermophila]|uniref:uncharacterized protein n=1 Tax=Calcarisporiella thermophila TaxID=911321 RepID=UPI003742DCE4